MPRFRSYPTTVLTLSVGAAEIKLLAPANSEALVDSPDVARRFEDDEYMPYWAQVWPAGLLLAETVSAWSPPDAGRFTVLELGCGLGLASLVLARAGFRVLATDYDRDALAFVVESAGLNGLPPPATRVLDWRRRYDDLHVDRIVAADVLYETRNLRPIAEFVRAHLCPGGQALIVDPNRGTADDFDVVACHCGLAVRTDEILLPNADHGAAPVAQSTARPPDGKRAQTRASACRKPVADKPVRARVFRLQPKQ